MPATPVSVTIIAKNAAKSLNKTLASLRASFLRPESGDELVVLDTGSTDGGETVRTCIQHGA